MTDIREATAADIPALAELHVKAWNATYPRVKSPPTRELRERQWHDAFRVRDGSWVCFLIEDRDGKLIGFAKGKKYQHSDLPQFSGELNKIYVLKEYHRRGLGRRLVGHVVRWFLDQGIASMVLFAEPDIPSCRFYDALGAENVFARNGEFHGTYGWRDLRNLAARCPNEEQAGLVHDDSAFVRLRVTP